MTLELRPAGAQKVLVNTAATLTSYKLDQYGDHANPGTTTVTVTRANGDVVDTDAATTENSTTHEVSYALAAADNTRLDWLQAVWTDDSDDTTWTTYHEVVGGFYFSTTRARGEDSVLGDATKWNDAAIRGVRDEVEWEIESIQACNRAFVPRYRRVRLTNCGSRTLLLPDGDIRTVRSVRYYTDVDSYESLTAGEVANINVSSAGIVTRSDGVTWWPGYDIVVEYEYGLDRPPPDLLRAILRRVRWFLARPNSGQPERAVTFTTDNAGSYSLAVPGRNGWITADADVDLLIRRYRLERAGIG